MPKSKVLFWEVLCKTQIDYTAKKQNLQYVHQKRQQMRGKPSQAVVILTVENADFIQRPKS